MNQVLALVDQVIHAFESRRRTAWSVITLPLTSPGQELERWQNLVQASLKIIRHSTVDRQRLIERVKDRCAEQSQQPNFGLVAEALQQLARDELSEHLIKNGVPEDAAHRIVERYSIGAMLHDS